MKAKLLTKLKIVVILLLSLSLNLKAQTGIPNAINYMLPADEAVVSKGIYTTGGILIRTLEQNTHEAAGTHTAYWDGYDNDGNLQPIGSNYVLKVAYNNNVYIWEGVVGNSSDSTTGVTVLRGGSQICSANAVNGKLYVATGYAEVNASQKYATVGTQTWHTYSTQPNASGQTTYFTCASSKFNFWGGENYNFSNSFVFPERLSNNTEIKFANTTFNAQPGGRGYDCLDLTASSGLTGMITGMACQQNGSGFLFIAHGSANTIDVLRTADSSGVKVQTISISNPGNLTVENDNILWVAQGTTVTKYSINTSTGAIIPTGVQLTGFSNVCGLHAQSGDLAVLDGGSQDVLKHYNSTTLALIGTIGIVGGYSTTPTVANNRFYLNDLSGPMATFVTHDASGGFYIGDAGNSRVQHFNSSGTFIESIMHIATYVTYQDGSNKGICYPVNLCGNQNTALFSDFYEFTIDYSQPLKTGWTLTNNYGYNLPANWHNTNSVSGVYKYPNGRRFMLVTQKAGQLSYLAELTSTGLNIIMTPVAQAATFDKAGNLTVYNITNKNITNPPRPAVTTYKKYIVTVPSSGNPTVGAAIIIANVPSGYQEPIPTDTRFNTTNNGKLIVFDPLPNITRNPSNPNYYHTSIYDSLTMARLARIQPGTLYTYQGDMLTDGTFDIGNGVKYGGSNVSVVGNSFYVGYHGEFWKQNQTNIFYKFNDLGLLQGMFGTVGPQVIRGQAMYGSAGNALAVNATTVGGNDYIYHGDESVHDGTHRWKISNTSSEGIQSITFTPTNRTLAVQNNITDMLTNIPGGQSSIQGIAGTSQSPITDVKSGSSSSPGQFYSTTRTHNFYSYLTNDVHLFATALTGTRNWKINLTNVPAQWTFYGQLDLAVNSFVANESSSTAVNYIDIADNAGKSIVRMYLYNSNRIKINGTFIGPFNKPKYGASDFVLQRDQQRSGWVYFYTNIFGTSATYSGPMQDPTADITHPTTFGIYVQNLNVGFGIVINKLQSIN